MTLTPQNVVFWYLAAILPCVFLGRPLIQLGLYRALPVYELGTAVGVDDMNQMADALQHGADINNRTGFAHRTPLMTAALHGRANTVAFLLANGANADARDDKGYTALQIAVKEQHEDVAHLLTRHITP